MPAGKRPLNTREQGGALFTDTALLKVGLLHCTKAIRLAWPTEASTVLILGRKTV